MSNKRLMLCRCRFSLNLSVTPAWAQKTAKIHRSTDTNILCGKQNRILSVASKIWSKFCVAQEIKKTKQMDALLINYAKRLGVTDKDTIK